MKFLYIIHLYVHTSINAFLKYFFLWQVYQRMSQAINALAVVITYWVREENKKRRMDHIEKCVQRHSIFRQILQKNNRSTYFFTSLMKTAYTRNICGGLCPYCKRNVIKIVYMYECLFFHCSMCAYVCYRVHVGPSL